jgi:2C-methyl-D-erythritol 2,4-cyclodiphosphate synthase
MMEYLGIDSYSELPFVLEKMEEQHGSIEMLDSKLTDEIDKLEKEKAEMENKIKNLKVIT